MTLPTVCRRCDGPCQCGLDDMWLEEQARSRYPSEEELRGWKAARRPKLCEPNMYGPLGMLCRVGGATKYTTAEKIAHLEACGKPCSGRNWLRDLRDKYDPLSSWALKNLYPKHDDFADWSLHQIAWDDRHMYESAGSDAP